MAEINIGKAPSNSAVLPFYATAAVAFAVLCILLQLSAASLTQHYFSPHLLTIVHTAALGWGTMIIFGAAYQLLPVICEKDLFSSPLAYISWYFLTIGVALLTWSFWDFTTGTIMITGGSMIVIAAIMYFINVYRTGGICKRYNIQKLFIVSSAFWLLFTVVVGLLLAINLSHPFFEKDHLQILKLHAHAGLAGWFLQLITGVSTKLVPMFLLAKSSKNKLLNVAYILQNAGLILFLADAYFLGYSTRAIIYAALVVAGIICWILYLYDAYKHRVRKKIDFQMKHTFVSIFCLLLAIVLIPVIHFSKGTQWTILYGTLLFMGWITSIILGMTFKTLPFIIWNAHYKNLSGKVKVPMPKHLYDESLVTYQFWSFIAALIVLALGIVLQQILIIRLGLGLWIIVAAIYFYNVLKIFLHKTKTLL